MNPVMIIPTYISSRKSCDSAEVIDVYDHTTALSASGELPRLLISMENFPENIPVMILVSSSEHVAEKAEKNVCETVARFPEIPALVIGRKEEDLVHQRMQALGISDIYEKIALKGYSAIKNMGLVLANVFGFDSVIFVDDDEVIEDPDFIKKAMYGLGKLTKSGVPILAKSGFFLNEERSYLSNSANKWYNRYWDQGAAFNKWITKAMKGKRIQRSNHVCGGCLALHKEAYNRVAFDPWIPRGEDMDYLLDLRAYGSDIWFDKLWHLVHLPPKTNDPTMRFRQDIIRWLYMYRKIEFSRTQIDLLQIKPESLMPYPGPFLQSNMYSRIWKTAQIRRLAKPHGLSYRKAANAVRKEASQYAEKKCNKYFGFQNVWPEIIKRMANDNTLSKAILQASNKALKM
ncbi:MAG: hypothetical protein HUJ51_03850 [Eggerthellaceae bacterium]|nr:hypothetical protein [Eggerthellaceae bacterium]